VKRGPKVQVRGTTAATLRPGRGTLRSSSCAASGFRELALRREIPGVPQSLAGKGHEMSVIDPVADS